MDMRKFLVLLAVATLVLTASSCQFVDKLKARDHLNQGVAAYSGKRYDDAIEEFQTAIELDPDLIDAYLYLAAAYRAQFVPMAQSPDNLRKGQQAIAAFEEVLDLDPDNENAMANIADLYRNMEKPEEAKDWYRKLMDVQEDKSQALYGIAVIDYNLVDAETGKDGQKLEETLEEMPEEEREQHLQKLSERVDEGIEALKQSLDINPQYTDAMEYLNLMYREKAELAQDEEEKQHWENEADRLALQALDMKRQLQREAERARRQVFEGKGEESSE